MEIERKYVVEGSGWETLATRHYDILQGYLCADGLRTVRVRLRDEEGFLTIKGPSTTDGLARFEWEKRLTKEEALALFALCHPGRVGKTRYILEMEEGLKLELDVFYGENEGLVLAEIEFESEEQSRSFNLSSYAEKWPFQLREVTGDKRYYNAYLSAHPFTTWEEQA